MVNRDNFLAAAVRRFMKQLDAAVFDGEEGAAAARMLETALLDYPENPTVDGIPPQRIPREPSEAAIQKAWDTIRRIYLTPPSRVTVELALQAAYAVDSVAPAPTSEGPLPHSPEKPLDNPSRD